MKQYKLPSGAYTALKWAGLVACPAIATFVGVVGPVWGMPFCDAVVTTVNALGVCIGALIGYSAATAKEVGD
ncbi:phage holin [Collinsella stercoris]|uniref:phage holin n=1 Tax=Collinsella stercoris TaxID=147206 RepID=UPI00248DB773|nr:phage holin [Collinsella stercoris]